MSLSQALSSANSGLASTSRRADVSASNIANASTPGYVRRSVITSENVAGGQSGGVSITAIERSQDLAVSRLRRDADSAAGRSSVIAQAYQTLNTELGSPSDGYGLFATLENLESALKNLEATPESAALQNAVFSAANETTHQFNALSHLATSLRETADSNIDKSVRKVNESLYRLQDINAKFGSIDEQSSEGAALEDERQRLIDGIAEILPIKDVVRDNGQVDILTNSGVYLLSGNVRELSFERAGTITEGDRLGEAGSRLSGLFVGEQNLTPGTDGRHSLQSGSLAGQFNIRDSVATDFSDSLDGLAADLISRFSNDALDPTKAAGAPGIFTDGGLAHDPDNLSGTAARLKLNNAINPNAGGDVSRLRDGLGATTPGNSGNTAIISGLVSAMTDRQNAPAGTNLQGQFSVIDSIAGLTSQIGEQTLRHDSINSSTIARRDVLSDTELSRSAVDTDAELQNLLIIEQAYAANARVIQTISDMIDRLMQI